MPTYKSRQGKSQSHQALERGTRQTRFCVRCIPGCGVFVAIDMDFYPPTGRADTSAGGGDKSRPTGIRDNSLMGRDRSLMIMLFGALGENIFGGAEELGGLDAERGSGGTGLHTGLVVVARAQIAFDGELFAQLAKSVGCFGCV